MINFGQNDVVIERGARVAQVVFCPVARATWNEVDDLEATERERVASDQPASSYDRHCASGEIFVAGPTNIS